MAAIFDFDWIEGLYADTLNYNISIHSKVNRHCMPVFTYKWFANAADKKIYKV